MNSITRFCTALVVSGVLGTAAQAATTIDFTAVARGTAVTTQFAGVSFSLSGGADGGAPLAGSPFGSGDSTALLNSTSEYYPTAYSVIATFANKATGVSFTFNNYGGGNGSQYIARDGDGNVVSSGALDQLGGYNLYNVAGSGIRTLEINNGNNTSWLYGVGQLSFAAGEVPEPATWVMLIAGFGLVGMAARRRTAAIA